MLEEQKVYFHLSCLVQVHGQQDVARDAAVGEEELKRRNMKGLMAELETIDTPMIAWILVKISKTLIIVVITSTAPHQDMLHQESARISCLMNSSTM